MNTAIEQSQIDLLNKLNSHGTTIHRISGCPPWEHEDYDSFFLLWQEYFTLKESFTRKAANHALDKLTNLVSFLRLEKELHPLCVDSESFLKITFIISAFPFKDAEDDNYTQQQVLIQAMRFCPEAVEEKIHVYQDSFFRIAMILEILKNSPVRPNCKLVAIFVTELERSLKAADDPPKDAESMLKTIATNDKVLKENEWARKAVCDCLRSFMK